MTDYGDGMTTSVPLIAIPLKAVVRAFGITEIFQPYGIFLALGFALQGMFAFRILAHLTRDRPLSWVATPLALLLRPLFLRMPGAPSARSSCLAASFPKTAW